MSIATPAIQPRPVCRQPAAEELNVSESFVSDSLMDRFLVDLSIGGDGPLTRSIAEASTSGFIRDDPPHWAIEPFIPIEPECLVQYLSSRGELAADQQQVFRQVCRDVDSIMHRRSSLYQMRFGRAYESLDPDTDCKNPPLPVDHDQAGDVNESDPGASSVEHLIELCGQIMQEAAYRRLTQQEIEGCVGVASQWGVPLHVNFEMFEQLVVFARGDIVGTRIRRRLRNLYRHEMFEVPIYQRMVVIFQVRSDFRGGEELAASSLHLRMFKNIPQQDIDMLLPGTTVRISGVDRVKIILPSLGGFLMSVRKIAQYALLFAVLALHWTAILVVLILGYLVKSTLSYFQTKNRYQLNLNRNLYFQKLDTNAGVGYRLIQQARRQRTTEMILAYYAILSHGESISSRRLRRRCERFVREAIDIEVEFQTDPALEELVEMGVVRSDTEGWAVA